MTSPATTLHQFSPPKSKARERIDGVQQRRQGNGQARFHARRDAQAAEERSKNHQHADPQADKHGLGDYAFQSCAHLLIFLPSLSRKTHGASHSREGRNPAHAD